MAGLVFLKSTADIAFFFMLMGPAAVHFGAGLLTCILTCIFIMAGEVASFLISMKNDRLRLAAYIIPLVSIFLPAKSISWAIVCGIIFAYEIFTGISRRYIPENDPQKTIFKVTASLAVAMLIILLLAGAHEISYSVVCFSALVSMCCSVLIQRSLRHEPEIYTGVSFQAANIAVVVLVCAAAAVLGSGPVVRMALTALKTVYIWIASVLLYAVTYFMRGISYLFRWINLLFRGSTDAAPEPESVLIDPQSAEDIFGNTGEVTGFPIWLKIVGIVIAAAIVFLVLMAVFRKLAGKRTVRYSTFTTEKVSGIAVSRKRQSTNRANAHGVRKQYRKYLNLLKNEGVKIKNNDTSEDICEKTPQKYRCAAAAELRELYIEARYNNNSDREAADRARELLHEIKNAT